MKGNHYLHLKVEKILVISGEGIVRLQILGGGPVLTYRVCGNRRRLLLYRPSMCMRWKIPAAGIWRW
jgi:hypothetical protein